MLKTGSLTPRPRSVPSRPSNTAPETITSTSLGCTAHCADLDTTSAPRGHGHVARSPGVPGATAALRPPKSWFEPVIGERRWQPHVIVEYNGEGRKLAPW